MPPFSLPSQGLVSEGMAVGIIAGVVLGVLVWYLTRTLRQRGAFGYYVAVWWAWAIGTFAWLVALAAIAGPYALAGWHRGIYSTAPMTYPSALVVSALCGIFGVFLAHRWRMVRGQTES